MSRTGVFILMTNSMQRHTIQFIIACILASGLGHGAGDTAETVRARHLAKVAESHEANQVKYKGSPDVLLLPGLLADRRAQQITCHAEATGIHHTEPVEFFLVSPESGHDYEAMAVALVKPGDVRKGLEFIGMTPGECVDFTQLHFWPKGERVVVTLHWDIAGESRKARIEELILDRDSQQTLPASGLVFIGGRFLEDPDSGGERVLSADRYDPFSIAANYNEGHSILDVPRQAAQGDMYRRQTLNPDLLLPTNQLIRVTFEPEYKDGRKRVMDVTLHVSAREDGTAMGLEDIAVRLDAPESANVQPTGDLAGLLKTFQRLVEEGHDPFVNLRTDDQLSLQSLRELCVLLRSIEGENGIRVGPPPEGRLYYRAFSPPDSYRDRNARIAQPWELHLALREGTLSAGLTQIEETWKDGELRPQLTVSDIPLGGPETLRNEIDKRGAKLAVILVYADKAITQGQLMSYITPMLPTHPTVHVFVGEGEAPAEPGAR